MCDEEHVVGMLGEAKFLSSLHQDGVRAAMGRAVPPEGPAAAVFPAGLGCCRSVALPSHATTGHVFLERRRI